MNSDDKSRIRAEVMSNPSGNVGIRAEVMSNPSGNVGIRAEVSAK